MYSQVSSSRVAHEPPRMRTDLKSLVRSLPNRVCLPILKPHQPLTNPHSIKMEKQAKHLALFGGFKSWDSSEWTSSDDRVRGGASQSYLDISGTTATFHGNLDIKTLGGAGFASQRTVTDSQVWDLSAYDGVHLSLGKSDGKKYTFVIKDEVLPVDEGGRETSTVSWEYVDRFVLFDSWNS
jgi:hypothetical protein